MVVVEGPWTKPCVSASCPLLQLIRQYYESNHGMRLERAIEKEFDAAFKTMLLTVINEPVTYYAYQVPEQCTVAVILTWPWPYRRFGRVFIAEGGDPAHQPPSILFVVVFESLLHISFYRQNVGLLACS